MKLLSRARELSHDLTRIRRDLHRRPELAFEEVETAGRVAAELRALGLEPREGVGRTGVVADIGPGGGRTVALRADMDALPITEATGLAWASERPGLMHACGHDAHMAGLIGAARLLVEDPPEVGTVRLLFQPAEESAAREGRSGAPWMIEDGAMTGVDAVVGLHLWAHRPLGELLVSSGPVMAGSDEIRVTVHGRSAHAARPHEGIDAIVLAALGVTAAQTAVSRSIAPTAAGVVGFGTISGGSARNAVADRVRLEGTLRYFDPAVRDTLRARVRSAFGGLEELGARVEVEFSEGYPPVVNDPEVTRIVSGALQSVFGAGVPGPAEPTLAAEDFSFLAREAPGCFLWLGAAPEDGPREHHAPDFDIHEGALPLAATALVAAARALLNQPPPAVQS